MSQPGQDLRPLTGGRLFGAALLLGLANFMVILDATVANVSVPHIAGGLAVSPSQGTWVITSYSVAEAITVPLTGWLVQRFGAVKVFVAGMLGFGAFSILCGVAPTFGLLVAFRVMQGLCGGPILPTSQTLLLYIFPKERTAQAIGLWSMTTVVAPIAGPMLGGQISDTIGWSWIFFINIPVAAGVAFGAWVMLKDRETATRRAPIDYVGLALLVVWVGCLQILLDKGQELEWFASPTIMVLATLALVGFAAFLIWELTAEDPVVDLRIFRHRGFVVGVVTVSLTFGAFFASLVLIPLWLQTSIGYTATKAGYASSLNGVLAVVMAPIVARLVGRYDPRALVCFGLFWMAGVAFWRAGFTTDFGFWAVALPFLAQGFAMPFFFVPTTGLTLSSVLPEETASAAGVSSFLRTSAAAFATSLMATAWTNSGALKRAELTSRLGDVPGALSSLTGQGLSAEQATIQVDRLVQAQAVMLATNQMFLITVGIYAFAALVIWFAPRTPAGRSPLGGH